MDKFSELKAAASALKNMSDRKEKGLRTSPLQINAAAAKMRGMLTADAVLELLAERDADKKRIAELEAKTAMTMGVGSGNGNLFVHGDYDSIKAAQAIVLENESLRAKLATPVRLPDIEFVKISGIDFPVMRADIVKKEVRRAGFKVEGDE